MPPGYYYILTASSVHTTLVATLLPLPLPLRPAALYTPLSLLLPHYQAIHIPHYHHDDEAKGAEVGDRRVPVPPRLALPSNPPQRSHTMSTTPSSSISPRALVRRQKYSSTAGAGCRRFPSPRTPVAGQLSDVDNPPPVTAAETQPHRIASARLQHTTTPSIGPDAPPPPPNQPPTSQRTVLAGRSHFRPPSFKVPPPVPAPGAPVCHSADPSGKTRPEIPVPPKRTRANPSRRPGHFKDERDDFTLTKKMTKLIVMIYSALLRHTNN